MPRRRRIEFQGAISHLLARGNGRQRSAHHDQDRERLLDDWRRTVWRCGWVLLAFVVLGNHLHLLLRTPVPTVPGGGSGPSPPTSSGTGGATTCRPPLPGAVPGGADRGGDLLRDRQPLSPAQSRPSRARRATGRMALVERSRLRHSLGSPALGGPRRTAGGRAGRARRLRAGALRVRHGFLSRKSRGRRNRGRPRRLRSHQRSPNDMGESHGASSQKNLKGVR